MRQREDAFFRIKEAYSEENWSKAEALLRSYLREEIDLDKSWSAWLMLIDVSHKNSLHPDIVLTYLSDMLADYGDDATKKKFILQQTALVKEKNGSLESVIGAWEAYANQRNVQPKEAFAAYKKLLNLYYAKGNFAGIEEILHNCLALRLEEQDTAFCMYNLADMYAVRGEFELATDYLLLVLEKEIDPYHQAQAAFLYADLLQQQRKNKEALQYFEMAQEHYGNDAVVLSRITALKKLLKIK